MIRIDVHLYLVSAAAGAQFNYLPSSQVWCPLLGKWSNTNNSGRCVFAFKVCDACDTFKRHSSLFVSDSTTCD